MPSERVQRRIERFLDQAEEAADTHDWDRVFSCVDAVLEADPENGDAETLKRMAEAATRRSGQPSTVGTVDAPEDVTQLSATVETAQPTSFSSGRYTVSKFLGEGGKKKVYLAHDNTLDRDIAFALIKTEGLDETSRERVRREAQAMGRMGTHPCIMPIYDLGDESGQPFMVQPLMGGGDVEGLIEDAEGPLELERAIEIATQTAQGLSFAHGKGIVHRDLKPGNVWLDDDGAAKIGDFGLAVATDRSRLTVEKVMVGTVSYMPPEQATGGKVTPSADLYSLGAMLYEMCTGRVPFMGDDDIGIISQHINTPPVAPSWHNSQIPKTLDSLILRLLSKDPAERPESADEVLAALDAVDLNAVEEREEESKGSLDAMAGGVFVGRHREMDQLKSIFEDVLSGRGRMVTLVGEPGIGKTRTAQELATYAGMRGAEVLWGRSYESGGAPPYWPWVQAIRSHVAATEPDDLRRQLGATASVIAEIVSEVNASLPDLQPPPVIDDPESARFRLFDSIATFLKQASQNAPMVLMLEDLHWSDKPSLMLLEFVARELANSRILIVGNYRDMELNRRHPLSVTLGDLSRERLFERVVLRGLQKHDVQRFIEIATGITPPLALVDTVFKQTEGNPLFVTETVRLLIQEGDITSGQSSKGGTTSWEIRIPEGVREVIGRRLDRLSERCNEVLTIAAVIGRQFRFDVLKMLAEDTTDNQLLDAMDEALSARIVEELPDEVGFYQFTHASMQETLIGELSHTRAVRMHARIAEALDQYYGDDAEQHASELVEHFHEAETVLGTEKLIRYSIAAGESTLAAVASQDAKDHFDRAIDALEDRPIDGQRARALLGLSRATAGVVDRSQMQTAFDIMMQAFDYYDSIGDAPKVIEIASRQIGTQANITGGVDLADRALKYLEDGSPRSVPILILKAGALWFEDADEPAATAALDAAQSFLEANPDDSYMTGLLATRASLGSMSDRDGLLTRLRDSENALKYAAVNRDPVMVMRAQTFNAVLNYHLGRTTESLAASGKILEMSRQHGLPAYAETGFMFSALVHLVKGNWAEIESVCGQFSEATENPAPKSFLAFARKLRGLETDYEQIVKDLVADSDFTSLNTTTGVYPILLAQILYPELRLENQIDELLSTLRSDKTMSFVRERRILQIEMMAAIANRDATRVSEFYEPLIHLKSTFYFVSIDRLLALGSRITGNLARAEQHFEDAIQFQREHDFPVDRAWTCWEYSELLTDRNAPGDREKAIELQDEAISIATELGMKPLLERVLAKREILKA